LRAEPTRGPTPVDREAPTNPNVLIGALFGSHILPGMVTAASDEGGHLARTPLGPWVGGRSIAAPLAFGVLLAGCAVLVTVAAAGPSILVAGSEQWASFPGWVAGPLHGIIGHVTNRASTLRYGFSAVMVAMTIAYLVLLRESRSLPMRVIAVFIVLAELILLLGPALQMTDMFNYLGYARLGARHGLNPYTHVINDERHDPVYQFATWGNWHSPYGSLFTVLTYPLGLISLPAAFWTLKIATVLASFAFLWLVARCARLLGRDPRLPVVLVAANPIYLVYAVGEFHNDFFMLVPSMASIALLLSKRYRAAGVAVAIGIAVKLTVVLLLPFLLLGAPGRRARLRLLSGVLIGGVPLAALSIAMFGLTMPNVTGQSELLTGLSVPNLTGWALGLGGGTPSLLRAMNVLICVVVGYQLLRRRDWLTGAGWATLALLASLGWLMPWYVVWLLPLAAIASNPGLRRVALAATVFLVVAFLPVTTQLLRLVEINPSAGPVGLAAWDYERAAQAGPGLARDARHDARLDRFLVPTRCWMDSVSCKEARRQRRA
jgi:glycosyl transferase family 87